MNDTTTPLSGMQFSLTDYLRNPEAVAAPQGVEQRRLNVYQELIFNNIEDFLSSGFPVLRSLVAKEDWLAIARMFIANYRAQSPYFLEIGQEFLAFVQSSEAAQKRLPGFALELMHYEWVELALDVSAASHPAPSDGAPVSVSLKVTLSALAWPLVYQYPVQNIGPAYQPTEIPAVPTFLLVHRDRGHQVKFMALNGLSYALLEQLENQAEVSLDALIKNLFQLVHGNQGVAASDVSSEQALALVQRFVDQDILHIC